MVRMINKLTGTEMWVSESRVDEYKAAGHKLAAAPPAEESKKDQPKASTKAKVRK